MSNEGKVVRFTNITDERFEHAFGGTPFFVEAGESKLMPWTIADHLATHLARKILLKNDASLSVYDPKDPTGGVGKPIWNADEEAKVKSKILGEIMEQAVEAEKTEVEKLQEQIKKLNEFVASKFGSEEQPKVVQEGQYQDKAEVIAELEKRGIQFDARQKKEKLEELLK